jgi:hypothetical protein
MTQPQRIIFKDDGSIPNSRYAVLLYRGAVDLDNRYPASNTLLTADHLPGLAVNLRPLGHSAPVGRAALPGLLRVDAGPARW